MNITEIERQKLNESMELCSGYCNQCKEENRLNLENKISVYNREQLVVIEGREIRLSNRAFRVLCGLLKYHNTPVSFEFLHDYGWPDNIVVRNNLVVTIAEIRTNLKGTDITIHNVRGYGYILAI